MWSGEHADHRHDALALGGSEPGERLVEQQQLRPRGQRKTDLEQPLSAVREAANLRVLDAFQAEELDERARLLVHVLERSLASQRLNRRG